MKDCEEKATYFYFTVQATVDASSVGVSAWSDIFIIDFNQLSGLPDVVCEYINAQEKATYFYLTVQATVDASSVGVSAWSDIFIIDFNQ